MIALFVFLITIGSFLFYGVVGEDKTWLLAPAFILNYALVTVALVKNALGAGIVGGVVSPASPRKGGNLNPSNAWPAAYGLWVVFLIYGIAVIPWAAVPFESKLVMLFVASVVGAYGVFGLEWTTFKDGRFVVGALLLVVMLAALYGLVVHFKCPDKVLWADRYVEYEGRLASTYICPNHFAHLMQMLLPFCLVLLFIPQAGIYLRMLAVYSFLVFLPTLYLTESRAGWLGSITAVGVTVCLMAIRRSKKLFTLLVLLVPLCSFLILLAGWQYSETFQRRMKPVVEFLEGQAEGGVGSESRDFRPQTWMDTIDMIKARPRIGFGPGNYRYTFPEYRNRCNAVRMVTGHPHNEYLELAADYGLIGFGLFSVAWLYGLVQVLRLSLKTEETRHAFLGFAFLGTAAGTMVHSFFDFEMHVYPNALVFALLAAIAVGPLVRAFGGTRPLPGKRTQDTQIPAKPPTTRHQQQPSGFLKSTPHRLKADSSARVSSWRNKAVAWLLAAGFISGTVFCVQVMGSSYMRALGDHAFADNNVEQASRFYQWAVTIDPQNWKAEKGMGDLCHTQRYYSLDLQEKRRMAAEERDWYEKALRNNSHDPELLMGLGKALIFLGRSAVANATPPTHAVAAIAGGSISLPSPSTSSLMPLEQIERGLDLLRQACAYRKFNDIYWWSLGVELRKAGQYEEALEVFHYANTLKRTPSIIKNIQWLEAQRAGHVSSKTADVQPQAANLRLKEEEMDLGRLFELMEK